MRRVVSVRYGRCLEGWQRTRAEIEFRYSQLENAERRGEPVDLDNDFDLMLLGGDLRDWENLLRQTPMFVGQDT